MNLLLDKYIKTDKKVEQLNEKFFGFKTSIIFLIVKLILLVSKVIKDYNNHKNNSTYDSYWTNKINKIIEKDKLKVVINVFESNNPNAHVTIKNEIFYSTKLKQILSENEFTAVLLHEVGHVFNRDAYRDLAISMKTFLIYDIIFGALFEILPFKHLLWIIKWFFICKTNDKLKDFHKWEYDADSYAVSCGFGNYFISGLTKMTNYVADDLKQKIHEKDQAQYKDIDTEISNLETSSHPSLLNRIKLIYTQIERGK